MLSTLLGFAIVVQTGIITQNRVVVNDEEVYEIKVNAGFR